MPAGPRDPEPDDATTEGPGGEPEPSAAGPARWTVPVPDAAPRWAPLERAWGAVAPRQVLTWSDAHLLPDGGRVDAFVCRRDGGVLLLGGDGRPWRCTGAGPGAVGRSLLLVPGPLDELARVLRGVGRDPVLDHACRTCGGRPRPPA